MAEPQFEFICLKGFDELPPDAVEVFSRQWEREYFFRPRWYAYLVSHFFPKPEEFRLWLGRGPDGSPAMLFPARRTLFEPRAMGALALHAASHWENAAPMGLMFNREVASPDEILTAFLAHLKSPAPDGETRPYDVLRIWPIDKDTALAGVIYRSLERTGYWLQAYKNSFNQYERVEGKDFDAYFEERSYNFRYNLRRKRRKLEGQHDLTFHHYQTPDMLDTGLREYEAVSLASWKVPHSMVGPVFFDLIEDAIEAGVGRLSTMKLDGKPVSTQFWIVSGGVGHIIRLAYDKDYEKLGVGIVHNAEMILHVMENDGVGEINYGYGNEESKAKWTRQSRIMYGVMAFNTRTRRGLYHGFKNIVGSGIKQRVIRPIRERVRGRPKRGMLRPMREDR